MRRSHPLLLLLGVSRASPVSGAPERAPSTQRELGMVVGGGFGQAKRLFYATGCAALCRPYPSISRSSSTPTRDHHLPSPGESLEGGCQWRAVLGACGAVWSCRGVSGHAMRPWNQPPTRRRGSICGLVLAGFPDSPEMSRGSVRAGASPPPLLLLLLPLLSFFSLAITKPLRHRLSLAPHVLSIAAEEKGLDSSPY